VCDALVVLPQQPPQGDVHLRVALQQCAEALGGWLAQRSGAMVSYAAQDIVAALSQATKFLRDRMLQLAFGARDLWALVGVVNQAQGSDAATVRLRVELGREGATVLGWLAGALAQDFAFDANSAQGQQVMAAAESWRSAWARLGLGGAVPAQPRYGSSAPLPPTASTAPGGTGWL
jgi:hypothetical protein